MCIREQIKAKSVKVDSTRKSGKLQIDETKSTSGITFDADLASHYSEKILKQATALKATYGSKYSDEYYLEYAARNIFVSMVDRLAAPSKKNAMLSEIQDPDWQGYSYEEIIQMENSGATIPEEVILWAHAQQESDEVSYQILESEAQADDNSSTGEVTNDNDSSGLLKKAKQYTLKAEKAQKNAELQVEKYNDLLKTAKTIQEQNQNTYKSQLNEISALTKEWNKLDSKNKNNTLTASEKERYQQLSKSLTGTTANVNIKETAFNASELDELLSSMEGLDTLANENLKISEETITAGEEIANLSQNSSTIQQHSTKSTNNSLSNPVSGAPATSIPTIAVETGNNLADLTNEITSGLNSEENNSLKDFAREYSRTAQDAMRSSARNSSQQTSTQANSSQQTTENTPSETASNTKGTTTNTESSSDTAQKNSAQASGNSSQNADSSSEDSGSGLGKNKEYSVSATSTEPKNALKATLISALSTADLKNKQSKVNGTETTLANSLLKTSNQAKKLQKSNKQNEKLHAQYEQQAESYNAELENLQTQKVSEPENTMQQSSKSSNNQIQNTNEEEVNSVQTQNTQQDSAEEENVISQVANLTNLDAKLKTSSQKDSKILEKLIKNNKTTTTKFNEQNKILTERNKNAKEVSLNTTICGGLTVASGAYNLSVGIPLLSNPTTHAAGVATCKYAAKQLITGAGAATAGGIGLSASSAAADDINSNDETITKTNQQLSNNSKITAAANKITSKWENIAVPTLDGQENQEQTAQQPAGNTNSAAKSAADAGLENNSQKAVFSQSSDITSSAKQSNKQEKPAETINTEQPQNSKTNEEESKTQVVAMNLAQTANVSAKNQKAAGNNSQMLNTSVGNKPQNQNIPAKNQGNNTTINQTKVQSPEQPEIPAKTEKDSIIAQLQTLDAKGEFAENSSDDKLNDIMKANLTKTQSLSKQFDELNTNIQTKSAKNKEENEIKTVQEEFKSKEQEVNSIVQKASERVKKASKTSKDTSVENQEISKDDMVSIVKDVYSEKEIENQAHDENDDETIIAAASASTNASIVKNTNTEDKTERKLARFNNDSIIESRKKKKKVQAVSAASGQKA